MNSSYKRTGKLFKFKEIGLLICLNSTTDFSLIWVHSRRTRTNYYMFSVMGPIVKKQEISPDLNFGISLIFVPLKM